jgi:hypothetical protein
MWILLLHWRKYKGMSLNDYSVQQMLQEGRATYNMGTIFVAPEWTAEASSTSTQKRVISYKIDRDYPALRAIFGIKEGAWTTTGEPMKNPRPGEHYISFTSNLLSASGDCLLDRDGTMPVLWMNRIPVLYGSIVLGCTFTSPNLVSGYRSSIAHIQTSGLNCSGLHISR